VTAQVRRQTAKVAGLAEVQADDFVLDSHTRY
jgi:hypothetical protein